MLASSLGQSTDEFMRNELSPGRFRWRKQVTDSRAYSLLSLCFLVTMSWVVFLPPCCLYLISKSNGTNSPWTEISVTMSQNSYFLPDVVYVEYPTTATEGCLAQDTCIQNAPSRHKRLDLCCFTRHKGLLTCAGCPGKLSSCCPGLHRTVASSCHSPMFPGTELSADGKAHKDKLLEEAGSVHTPWWGSVYGEWNDLVGVILVHSTCQVAAVWHAWLTCLRYLNKELILVSEEHSTVIHKGLMKDPE